MNNKARVLKALLVTGGIIGGSYANKIFMKNKQKKRLLLKDVIPYLRDAAEVRKINQREPLFNVFMKNGNSLTHYLNNKDRILEQNFLPTDTYLIKSDSFSGNINDILNTEVCAIKSQRDNDQMLEIVIL